MAQGAPDVTVIVPVYNGSEYIDVAMGSVVRQSIGLPTMQVMLMDDGSTDDSPAILDRWARDYPSLEVFHMPPSGGPAVPRNVALQTARGRYVFFLDQDDYLSDDALEAMVRAGDENGTDVIMPRGLSLGGRNTPRAMFARTRLKTDAFESAAYWTLAPNKMFRMDAVRRLDLRFEPSFRIGEDLPFVLRAMLEGSGMSVLADKDYLFAVNRADKSNLTTSRLVLSDRLPCALYAFDIVERDVPEGADRNKVLNRCFKYELLGSVFPAYRRQAGAEARDPAFAEFERLVARYYGPSIEAMLTPDGRVLMWLVSQGRRDEFDEYLRLLESATAPPAVIEGERVFAPLPWFRDDAHGVPDSLFDVTSQLRVEAMIDPLEVEDNALRLTASCGLGVLTEQVTDASIVLRPRAGGTDVVVPVTYSVDHEEIVARVLLDDQVTAKRLLSGVRPGDYDLLLRLAAGEVARERRFAESGHPEGPRTLRIGMALWPRFGILVPKANDALSLQVSGPAGRVFGPVRAMVRPLVRAVRGSRRASGHRGRQGT